MTYHLVLTKKQEILQKALRHTVKSQLWTAVLPSPLCLAFHNAKTLRDYLVRAQLKTAHTIYGRKICKICHTLHQVDKFESPNTCKQSNINISYNYNSRNVVYMLTCKKQYVGSNTSSSEEGYTSTNPIKFYMGFMQETLTQYFFKK